MTKSSIEKTTELKLTVLLHQDGSAWVAQCLEHDVAAQGPTPDEAKRRFLRTLGSQILVDLQEGRAPLINLDQAPPWYFDKSISAHENGPELPVFIPAKLVEKNTRFSARARFLETGAGASAALG